MSFEPFSIDEIVEQRSGERLVGRFSLSRERAPFLADHHVEQGQSVLPAVFGMALLEQAAARLLDGDPPRAYCDLDFRRFLEVPGPGAEVEVFAEAERDEEGALRLCLHSRMQGEGFSRRLEHVTARVPAAEAPASAAPAAERLILAEPTLSMRRDEVHPHVVPFGPAFWNVHEVLQLSREGAVGLLVAPEQPGGAMRWIRDAAYQLASTWAQRYTGRTAVPVGVGREVRIDEVKSGEAVLCRIVPHPTDDPDADPVVDALLYGEDGRPLELLEDLRSSDVTRGRRLPPGWHTNRDEEEAQRERLTDLPARLLLIDQRAPVALVDAALTLDERRRFAQLGERRLPGWRAVRLALKRMGQELASDQELGAVALDRIQTLRPEDPRLPACLVLGADPPQPLAALVSASHDLEYGLAAVDEAGEPIGVDVERIEERAVRVEEMFLAEEERGRVRTAAGASDEERFTRAWSAKEAVAKARGEPLAEARRKVQIRAIKPECVELRDSQGAAWRVTQVLYRGHVVSVARCEGGLVA